VDEQAIRRQADELRELARQREAALRAAQASKQAAEDEFRAGVTRFAAEAVRRLTGAGVPPVRALLAPSVVADGLRWRSWQRPTLRQRLAARRQPAAAPPGPRQTLPGWQLPFIDPTTGARRTGGRSYTVMTYERGDVSGQAPGRLIVFLGTDGVLRFAGEPVGDGEHAVHLYPYADITWLRDYAGKEVTALPRADIVNALGLARSSRPEWEVGADRAAEELYDALDHNAKLADGLLVGWYAALEDLLASAH
jgi:hypothetical protein